MPRGSARSSAARLALATLPLLTALCGCGGGDPKRPSVAQDGTVRVDEAMAYIRGMGMTWPDRLEATPSEEGRYATGMRRTSPTARTTLVFLHDQPDPKQATSRTAYYRHATTYSDNLDALRAHFKVCLMALGEDRDAATALVDRLFHSERRATFNAKEEVTTTQLSATHQGFQLTMERMQFKNDSQTVYFHATRLEAGQQTTPKKPPAGQATREPAGSP